MQKIIVKNVTEKQKKDGSGSFYIISDITGADFSLFEPPGFIKPGATIEAEIEVKGKYANIQNFKILSQSENPPQSSELPVRHTFSQDSPEKRRSIERQTSAQIAFQFEATVYGRDWSLRDSLNMAEAIHQWISKGVIPPAMTSSTSEKAPPVAQKAEPPSDSPAEPEKPPDLGIDMDWLHQSLKDLQWTTVMAWLKKKYPEAVGTRVSEMVKSLTLDQRKEFAREVESRLKVEHSK